MESSRLDKRPLQVVALLFIWHFCLGALDNTTDLSTPKMTIQYLEVPLR
jgi:hypothetical protein